MSVDTRLRHPTDQYRQVYDNNTVSVNSVCALSKNDFQVCLCLDPVF